MTDDDKVNLLLGVCGVEIANRAAEHVRVWRRLARFGSTEYDDRFAFTRAKNVKDFIVGLITQDLNGGALDAWLKETGDVFDRSAAVRHQMTLDFYVDDFQLTLAVSRNRVYPQERTEADSIKIQFMQPPPDPEHGYVHGLRKLGYKAGSVLIRRLDAENIRGWGACLTDGDAS